MTPSTDQRRPVMPRGMGSVARRVAAAARQAFGGDLPPRYDEPWGSYFDQLMRPSLQVGVQILDVGSGRRPLIAPSDRPSNCRYVGLDISLPELEAAPPGSYDAIVVTDVGKLVPEMYAQFDLVLSWQVLEHVQSLGHAVDAMRCYLRPGGRLVALLSGRFAAFSVLNRVIPANIGHRVVAAVMRRDRGTVFVAYYDACYETAIRRGFARWSSVEITPRWRGAAYLRFSRGLRAVYVAYEEWAYTLDRRNLATHYFIEAIR